MGRPMRPTLPWALLLVVPVLAGCLGDGSVDPEDQTPVDSPAWATQAIFLDDDPGATGHLADHDHGDRALHAGRSTPNFEVVGWNPLADGDHYEAPAGTYWCGDVSDAGERRLAVVHSFATEVALVVLDVTDPEAPVQVGELVMPQVFTYDVAITEDGRYAAIAGNPDLGDVTGLVPDVGAPDAVPMAPFWRDACGQEHAVESQVDPLPRGYSTILVDLADPTAPVVADFFADQSRNMHSVSATRIDGTYYVVSSSLQAVPCNDPLRVAPCLPVPRYGNLLSHFNFFTVEDPGTGARLLPYATYSGGNFPDFDADLLALNNGHVDATLQQHPDGDLIGYLAHWDGGFLIVRLDGPGQITPLATWGEFDESAGQQMTGNIHSAVPLGEFPDGRHYTLTGQEVVGRPAQRPTGQIVLMDTTDPSMPTPVARWTLPFDLEWPASGLLFSTHYPVYQDGFLFVPLYHGGVWAADMRQEVWPELPTVGVFLPDREPPEAPVAASHAPEVLEVQPLGQDRLLVFDGNSGAYTVRFTGYHEDVVPAAPWTEDAWIGP